MIGVKLGISNKNDDSTSSDYTEMIDLPHIGEPLPIETDSQKISCDVHKMSLLEATSTYLGVSGVLAEKMTSMIEITELKPMLLREITNNNNDATIAFTSSQNLKRHLEDNDVDIKAKQFKLEILEEPSSIGASMLPKCQIRFFLIKLCKSVHTNIYWLLILSWR
jgi:hypothetical protein